MVYQKIFYIFVNEYNLNDLPFTFYFGIINSLPPIGNYITVPVKLLNLMLTIMRLIIVHIFHIQFQIELFILHWLTIIKLFPRV